MLTNPLTLRRNWKHSAKQYYSFLPLFCSRKSNSVTFTESYSSSSKVVSILPTFKWNDLSRSSSLLTSFHPIFLDRLYRGAFSYFILRTLHAPYPHITYLTAPCLSYSLFPYLLSKWHSLASFLLPSCLNFNIFKSS